MAPWNGPNKWSVGIVDGPLVHHAAQVSLDEAKQQSFERVERHVVAVVDGRLVLEDAAAEQHDAAGDDRVEHRPAAAAGRVDGAGRQLDAAEEMVDALFLDETDVVGQRLSVVGGARLLVATSLINVDDDDDDNNYDYDYDYEHDE